MKLNMFRPKQRENTRIHADRFAIKTYLDRHDNRYRIKRNLLLGCYIDEKDAPKNRYTKKLGKEISQKISALQKTSGFKRLQLIGELHDFLCLKASPLFDVGNGAICSSWPLIGCLMDWSVEDYEIWTNWRANNPVYDFFHEISSEYYISIYRVAFYLPAKSATDKGMVSYVNGDPSKTRYKTSMGKLLRKILPNTPDSYIQRWAERWNHQNEQVVLHMAKDSEHIYQIYKQAYGFRSCMTGSESVKAYDPSFNEYNLSYITEDNTPDGRVCARAFVRFNPPGYIRIYGDQRILMALQEAGYGKQVNLDGCRIHLIKYRRSSFRMPYLDLGYGGTQYVCYNEGDTTGVIDGSIEADSKYDHRVSASSSSGIVCVDSDNANWVSCDCCGDEFNSHEEGIRDWFDNYICGNCEDGYVEVVCNQHGDTGYVHEDNVVQVMDMDGDIIDMYSDCADDCCRDLSRRHYRNVHLIVEDAAVDIGDDFAHRDDCIHIDDADERVRDSFSTSFMFLKEYEQKLLELEKENTNE